MNAYDSAMTKIRNGQKIFRDNTVISLAHEMEDVNEENIRLRSQLAEAQAEVVRLTKILEGRKVQMPQETRPYIGESNPDIKAYLVK